MDAQPPLVLEGISLPELLRYILKTHAAPSALVICSTKETFLQQLNEATEAEYQNHEEDLRPPHPWTTPTLRLLASSRTVKVAFCPDLAHLRAYLAAYAQRQPADQDDLTAQPALARTNHILAILNPIQLHKPTSAYSAQGLNRTLASAVEAAYHTRRRLVLAECPYTTQSLPSDELQLDLEADLATPAPTSSTPWDEELSLLNVTTKSFGAGERGWVGRTVKVRTVAERWCLFQDMSATGQ
jgi:hypothetical protein